MNRDDLEGLMGLPIFVKGKTHGLPRGKISGYMATEDEGTIEILSLEVELGNAQA